MSTLPVHRPNRPLLPDLTDLLATFPSFAQLRPVFDNRLLRLEDEMKDGRYEVRAEIPGLDPAEDVDVTVRDGLLTIKAERTDKKEGSRALGVQLRLVRTHHHTAGGCRRGRHQGHLRQGHSDRVGWRQSR